MKRMLIVVAAVLLAISCRVEKSGRNTYTVTAPTPEAKAAAEKAAGDLKRGTKEAAQKTGTALEHAGKELREHTATMKTETRTETTATRH